MTMTIDVLDSDWPEVRRFLLWIIALCFILLALIFSIARWVKINHELEREFAERYSVSNVDVAGGGTDVTWTNTEGTNRCTGRWVEGDLVIRFCWQILPPAQPAER